MTSYIRLRTEEPIGEFNSSKGFCTPADPAASLFKVDSIERDGDTVRITRQGTVVEYPWQRCSAGIVAVAAVVSAPSKNRASPQPQPAPAEEAPAVTLQAQMTGIKSTAAMEMDGEVPPGSLKAELEEMAAAQNAQPPTPPPAPTPAPAADGNETHLVRTAPPKNTGGLLKRRKK